MKCPRFRFQALLQTYEGLVDDYLAGRGVAPSFFDWTWNPLLEVTLSHRGRAGDSPVALSTFELLFEESEGDPLSFQWSLTGMPVGSATSLTGSTTSGRWIADRDTAGHFFSLPSRAMLLI